MELMGIPNSSLNRVYGCIFRRRRKRAFLLFFTHPPTHTRARLRTHVLLGADSCYEKHLLQGTLPPSPATRLFIIMSVSPTSSATTEHGGISSAACGAIPVVTLDDAEFYCERPLLQCECNLCWRTRKLRDIYTVLLDMIANDDSVKSPFNSSLYF